MSCVLSTEFLCSEQSQFLFVAISRAKHTTSIFEWFSPNWRKSYQSLDDNSSFPKIVCVCVCVYILDINILIIMLHKNFLVM